MALGSFRETIRFFARPCCASGQLWRIWDCWTGSLLISYHVSTSIFLCSRGWPCILRRSSMWPMRPRGYELVDSPKVQTEPGKLVDLKPTVAADEKTTSELDLPD